MARRVLLQTSSIQGVFRVDFCPVVTNVVNPSAFSVKMLVFGLRLTTFVTEVLARRFKSCWFDDVCNVGRPLVARPGPAAAHRHCGRSLWRPSAPSALASLALRRVAWCVLLQTSSIRGVFRVAFCPVVTNVVNPGAFSLIMVVFWLGLTTFVTEVLVRRFELRWFDDVCNVGRPLVARPGPVAAHGHRSQAPQSPHRCRVQTSLAALLRPDPISHVIPLRLFQTLNSDRWNCNVFWLC